MLNSSNQEKFLRFHFPSHFTNYWQTREHCQINSILFNLFPSIRYLIDTKIHRFDRNASIWLITSIWKSSSVREKLLDLKVCIFYPFLRALRNFFLIFPLFEYWFFFNSRVTEVTGLLPRRFSGHGQKCWRGVLCRNRENKYKKRKKKKQIKNRFFHKKPFFIEIKNQKIKNGFYTTLVTICNFFLIL